MSEWKQVVGQYFGQSEPALAFIKDVNGHIATYRAMKVADSWHPDPKDTYANLQEIRDCAASLTKLYMNASHQTRSYIGQGVLLIDPDDGKTAMELQELETPLEKLVSAIDRVSGELEKDPDVKRRGYHKHNSRNLLVFNITNAYRQRFDDEPVASNLQFADILEAILSSLGLPRANLHRVLSDSQPH